MNATYYCNGIEYPANIRLDKNRLSISVRGDQGTNELFWQYEKIKPRDIPRSFTYDDYPPQSLEILAPELATELSERVAARMKGARSRRRAPFVRLAAAAVLVFVLLYVAVVPWIAGLLASRFPASYEQQLGDQLYASLKNDFRVDEPATRQINQFFKALNIPSKYGVHITVAKGDVVNAFALPGGHIVVYDKLLNGINSYEELAALLSHEFVHVEERHTVRTLFRQMSSALFLSLLVGDLGGVTAIVLSNANELKNLSYSRSLESEADTEGARLLAERGISCDGFIRLFQLLDQQSTGQQPSEWLSSHPDLKKRIQQVRQSKACAGASTQSNEELRRIFLQLKTAE